MGRHGDPHVAHLEGLESSGGEHSADVDISVLDVIGKWKFDDTALFAGILLLALLRLFLAVTPAVYEAYTAASRIHLRPPLRAPPRQH